MNDGDEKLSASMAPEEHALMRLRLNAFWWSFGLSVAGFLISIVSLAVALTLGERLLTR